ncbi:P-loop containing nucleoside triphosphate hydrolase protein [Ascodesmis nigricans]|uniref:RNA helicase n=1 Tax=Ascodesmis nigricans TaxID=341454 RepID=A0A4S2MLI9_9PEZI|nr:P-loop containing nucleoside triphosphate hydrolase protein [Ascodesmis nigricans]
MLRLPLPRCPASVRYPASSLSASSRCYATREKRRPSRLVLSKTVAATGYPKQSKSSDVPPGGLNRTRANLSPRAIAEREKQLREAEEKRLQRKSKYGEADMGEADEKFGHKKTFKHLKMRQALAEVKRSTRDMMKAKEDLRFDEFGLLPSIVEAVKKDAFPGLEYQLPTAVQKIVIRALLKDGKAVREGHVKDGRQSYLIAAETGSGKTLAYILPLLEELKHDEKEEAIEEKKKKAAEKIVSSDPDLEIPVPYQEDPRIGHPRALILVPTAELVEQVGATLKSLSHTVKFRSALLTRDVSPHILRKKLYHSMVDVVVATPHLLDSMTQETPDTLSKVKHIIVDEADSLFDRSFSATTISLIKRSKNMKRLILCSATIPRSLDAKLREIDPDMKRLVTPNLHVIPRRVQLSVVDVDGEMYRGNRSLACADTLYTLAKEPGEEGFVKRVIVFVNERGTPAELAAYLRTKDIDAFALDRDSSQRSNQELLAMFTGDKVGAEEGLSGRRRMKVLVTTDILSRGIDTKTVKNVILYDVPHSTIDFIHRVGRVGRLGRRGRAFLLVDNRVNKGWVKDLKDSMFMGGPLV